MPICRWLILGWLPLFFSSLANAEVIKVEGGGAAASAIFYPMKESYEEATGDTLLVKTSSPVGGLIALEKGAVDIATAAAPLEELVRGAAKEGVTVDPATLTASVISQNTTVVFLHRPNSVDTLSKEQLKGIFTGKITNWREVGGADLAIDVVWGGKTPGQNALFTREILDGESVTAKATPATDYENIRELVIRRPGAIGIDPQGFKMGAVKIPTTPQLTAPIVVITKGAPSPKVKRLLDFVTSWLADYRQR